MQDQEVLLRRMEANLQDQYRVFLGRMEAILQGHEVFLRRMEADLRELQSSLRTVVRQEVQHALQGRMDLTPCAAPSILGNPNQAFTTGHVRLQFNNQLPGTIFTGNTIKAEDNASLQICIIGADKKIITVGPLSGIKVEILVLYGDFGDKEQDSWTEDSFNMYVLHGRKDRGPLLKGNQFITLTDGVGHIDNISFTDNSKWTRTQKFSLGAKAVQDDNVKVRIQEGISEAFSVNEQRSEYTMKHHIPSLEDDVWRLRNIRKDGPYHRRLVEQGINTVEDFLTSLAKNENNLRSILKITPKKWKIIVEHAQKCDRKQPPYQLPAHQQDLGNGFKHVVYQNESAVAGVDDHDPTQSLLGKPSTLLATCAPETNPTVVVHNANIQICNEVLGQDSNYGDFDEEKTSRAFKEWELVLIQTKSCSDSVQANFPTSRVPPRRKWVIAGCTIKVGLFISKKRRLF